MIRQRSCGLLLHVSSLPSDYGIGDFGPDAYKWVDFLRRTGQSLWQVLPLNPLTERDFHSPYQAESSFGGNTLFISPALLKYDGFLTEDDLTSYPALPEERVDYAEVRAQKSRLLRLAYDRFATGRPSAEFETFCERNSFWLDDFSLFSALSKRHSGAQWQDWPASPAEMEKVLRDEADEIRRAKFYQFLFFQQWSRLRSYANDRGVQIIGDLPFYVGRDSVDVWANPSLFKLDESKRPSVVAGVPPDAFSDTGQLWGSPVYAWDRHAQTGYAWWIARMKMNLQLFDIVRLDHFRGFAACWEVPAGSETAIGGKWVDGPADGIFQALLRHWPFLPIIAEDLGLISADVRQLMDRYQFPGMKVLLFAFDGDSASNPYSLHNHVPNAVLYTGTHDNNTIRGWYETEAGPEHKQRLADYLGTVPSKSDVSWALIRLAMMSVCRHLIIPMQDVLGLGAEARMNRPASEDGNWMWRVRREEVGPELEDRLSHLARTYGRT